MKKNNWVLVNVVWYDGKDAYVSKFVLQADNEGVATDEAKAATEEYLTGNGEILKFDEIALVGFDGIMALEKHEQPEYRAAFDRFKNMYF